MSTKNRKKRIVFSPALVQKVGNIGDILVKFKEEQTQDIEALLKKRDPLAPHAVVTAILDQFITREGTRHPLVYREINSCGLSQESLKFCLRTLVDTRLLRHFDGIYELSHDKLAEQIARNWSPDQRNLRLVQDMLKTKLDLYRESGALMSEEEIRFVIPYLGRVQSSELLENLLVESKRRNEQEVEKYRKLYEVSEHHRQKAEVKAREADQFNNALQSNKWLMRREFNLALKYAYRACSQNGKEELPHLEVQRALTEALYQPDERNYLSYEKAVTHETIIRTLRVAPGEERLLTITLDSKACLFDRQGGLIHSIETGELTFADFSPDGRLIVTGNRHGQIRFWNYGGQALNRLQARQGPVHYIAFSPGGQFILTAIGRVVDLWTREGELYQTIEEASSQAVKQIAVAPEGGYFITIDVHDHHAHVWDLRGNAHFILSGHTDKITYVAISPDSQLIATCSADRYIILWDRKGKKLRQFAAHNEAVTQVRFAPDGGSFATVSKDNKAILWNRQGKRLCVLSGHRENVNKVLFSPDGSSLLTTSNDHTARLWRREGTMIKVLSGHQGRLSDAVFLNRGERVATVSSDHTLRFWNVKHREVIDLDGHRDEVLYAAFSTDSRYLLTTSTDKTALLWDRTGKPKVSLLHDAAVDAAFFAPDGKHIVTCARDKKIYIWTARGEFLERKGNKKMMFNYSRFSPDGKHLISVTTDQRIVIFDSSFVQKQVFQAHRKKIYRFRFSPCGRYFVTASKDNSARIWKLDGELQAALEGHQGNVHSAVFSNDGRRIVTASQDATVRVWDLEGNCLHVLTGHPRSVSRALFSPNGKQILTLSMGYDVRLWSANGKLKKVLDGHTEHVNRIRFSSCGQYILTASYDKSAMLWTRRGDLIKAFHFHNDVVNGAFFSPDSRQFVTVSKDGTAKLFYTPAGIIRREKAYPPGPRSGMGG